MVSVEQVCVRAEKKARSAWSAPRCFVGCVRLLGLSLLAGLGEVVAPVEALHTASSVENALRPREERVALRADVNLELSLRAANLEGVAAGAGDGRLDVVWMDVGLHATPAAS